jgi:hypothetical protein
VNKQRNAKKEESQSGKAVKSYQLVSKTEKRIKKVGRDGRARSKVPPAECLLFSPYTGK